MKISQVMLAESFGGAERLFVDLCRALVEAGIDVQAICKTGSSAAQMLAADRQVRLETLAVYGAWDRLASRRIRRLLRQHGSELVQAHLGRGAVVAGRACRGLGLPLVVTTHNYIDVKYYRHVSLLLPPTRDQYNYYLAQGVAAERMQIINHFSPISPQPRLPDISPAKPRFLALGRLVEKKGFHILLEAFALMANQPGLQCELHIGGCGPQQQALQNQIDALDIGHRVSLVGWVGDVRDFLTGGDIFVLPSLDEPFGIVVLEAMATGAAIVATDCQGPKEILSEDTAWLVKTGDVGSLAAGLQLARDDHQARQEKSRRALQCFTEKYSKQAVIPEFIRVYDSLLATTTRAYPH